MSKTINDLRDALFETLQAVKSGEMALDRAKAMTDIGQAIINTAKVEVDYIRATGGDAQSKFIESPAKKLAGTALPSGPSPVVTRSHRIGG
jgi:hypothetical protein